MESRSAAPFVVGAMERFEKPLLRFAAGLVGASLAQDVVQDTFLKLCQKPRAEVETHLCAWLFTVAKNRALDLLRRNERNDALPEEEDLKSPDSSPQIKLERAQDLSRLQRRLRELDERQREVVLLKFAGGLSYRQIAEVTELSVSNVGFVLHTALHALRDEFGREQAGARARPGPAARSAL